MEDGGDAVEAAAEGGGVVEPEGAVGEAELGGEGGDRRGVAAGEDGGEAAPRRLARHQLAGVAVGAVEEPGRAGAHGPPGPGSSSRRIAAACSSW